MDTERINALLCTIEERSLTAAAEKLGYTTSGISRMMAALEEETGFPLLVRKPPSCGSSFSRLGPLLIRQSTGLSHLQSRSFGFDSLII